jgi:hypothetical protein
VQKDPKKKSEDVMMGYKPEPENAEEESANKKLLQRKKKMRVNNEFPIILN